ncbi:MAG: pSer/pThr/pTyr-binding forkhead associated (FHA) protein [Myxococcota bacterium]
MPELIVTIRDKELRRVPILAEETKIGRDEMSDLMIDNPGISRHHASIIYKARAFYVKDAGSQNGLFVNGEPVREEPLKNGDVLALGKFAIIFSTGGGVPEHKLIRSSSLVSWGGEEAGATLSDALRNPVATTALSPEEVEKLMAGSGNGPIHGPRRTISGPPSAPLRGPQPGLDTSHSRPTMKASEAIRAEREVAVLSRVNIFLGLLAVGLLGALVFLMSAD